jgi:predicted peroxiredoxin
MGSVSQQEAPKTKKLKIMMKSAWGSEDPTRASFPFIHGLALADAGHDVQIFLTGEATYTNCECNHAGGMAASERNPRKSCRQAHP